MLKSNHVVGIFSAVLVGLAASTSWSQDYPNRPVRIVTSAVGGGNDVQARIIAPRLSIALGTPVVIENVVSNLRSQQVAKAQPDGYTMVIDGNTLWTLPLMQKVLFDPLNDFSPITRVTREATILVVNPQLPVNSAKEVIALAKAKPGQLNWASGSNGSGSHLAGELFKSMAGIDIVRISYKGSGPAMNDVIGGRTQIMFASSGSAQGHIKAGRVKALGVGTAEPSALAPGLPTISATGLPGYESGSSSGAFFPAKTPAAIVNRLNEEIAKVLNTPDIKDKLLGLGLEVVSGPPERMTAQMKLEIARMAKLIKDTGLTFGGE